MSNSPRQGIPLSRIVTMSIIFGAVYFVYTVASAGFSLQAVSYAFAGMLFFGLFYFLFGRILRPLFKDKQ